MKLRVMTFNIKHCQDYPVYKETGKDVIDFNKVAEAIKDQDCEIVALNEVRNRGANCSYKDQAKILAKKSGFNHWYFGEAIRVGLLLPYGNAILSKHPFKNIETIKIPNPIVKDEKAYYESRCIIKAVIGIENKDLTFLVSHFGLANSEKINAVSTVCKLIDECNTPVVLMGDFNIKPDDIKLKPVYDRLKDTHIKSSSQKYSFPSDKPNIKIDYIFVSEAIEVESFNIPKVLISDHRPVVSELSL